MEMIGDLRTDALHEALGRGPIEEDTLLALLVLAFAGQNVSVASGSANHPFGHARIERHAVRLISQDGKLEFSRDTLHEVARAVLSDVWSCRENRSASGIVARFAGEATRIAGDKEHRRVTDTAAGAISPQKLYGVPVGLMFFEGARRLLASGVTIPHLHDGDPQRIAIEAYPGVLARQFIGRRSYKNDTQKKQTADQHEARRDLLRALRENAPQRYGFGIDVQDSLCDDPGADHLDALLCAVQAAWAWRQRDERFGATDTVDRLEGWIADPHLSVFSSIYGRSLGDG